MKGIVKDIDKWVKDGLKKREAKEEKELEKLERQLKKEKLLSKIDKEKSKRNKNKPKEQGFSLFGE